jgi:Holliday junction resolvase RusA-like endonuclease
MAHVYTPSRTMFYEKTVKYQYLQKYPHNKAENEPYRGAVKIDLTICLPMPKASKGKTIDMLANIIKPVKKPDCDNVEKSVLDGLTGAAFLDDSQVCDCHTVKRYGARPGVFIQMEEME